MVKREDIDVPKGARFQRAPEAVERFWIERLEELGPEVVRAYIAHPKIGYGGGAAIPFLEFVHDNKRYVAERWFVEAWLGLHDRQRKSRADLDHKLLWVAAIAAVVAVIVSAAQLAVSF